MTTKGETEANKNNPPKKSATNSSKSKSSGVLLGLFVFLTFAIAVAGIGAGYYIWQQLNQDLQTAKTERKALEHALSTLDENPRMQKLKRSFDKKIEQATDSIGALNKQLSELDNMQNRIAGNIQNTNDIVNRSQTGWMLKEVEHVLRMSQHRLLLDRDFQGALLGLNAADNRLREIDDVRLIPIRESISKQTQTLKQFPHPDYVGIQLTLDNTIAQLRTGLLSEANEAVKEQTSTVEQSKEITAKKEILAMDLDRLWAIASKFFRDTIARAKVALNDSVRITHGEQKIALFIEEQEKKRAYDFLRQKLLGAKYAVSTRDNLSFHQQLNAALAWLESNDQFTNKNSLIEQIKALDVNDLLPKLPDISEPSILLSDYVAKTKEEKSDD